jgi:Na+-transporting methylmalonyl-CoA/oxaloacetate decarboxylase gamma subunit
MGFMLILQGVGLVINIFILVYQLRTLRAVEPRSNIQMKQQARSPRYDPNDPNYDPNADVPHFDARRRPPM